MHLDPANPIVKLCIQGMNAENAGDHTGAKTCFETAWNQASGNRDKLIAAHFLARQQPNVASKLVWDRRALDLATSMDDADIQAAMPSLHLNIGKCLEDLGQPGEALQHYRQALAYLHHLSDDSYGRMTRAGVEAALHRLEHESGNSDD